MKLKLPSAVLAAYIRSATRSASMKRHRFMARSDSHSEYCASRLSALGFRRIAAEYKMDTDAIDGRFIFSEAALELQQQRVPLGFRTRAENALYLRLDEPADRLLEFAVGVGALELKEIQVAPVTVVVKAIEAVVVLAWGNLLRGAVTADGKFLNQVMYARALARRLEWGLLCDRYATPASREWLGSAFSRGVICAIQL